MKNNDKISLSVDTCISQGSFSLWKNDVEIDQEIGGSIKSRSEDIINVIDGLLSRNGLGGKNLEKIIYSNGPGSFTGMRVGISVVLGLGRSLQIPTYPVSIFEALSTFVKSKKLCVAGISLVKKKLAFQEFSTDKSNNKLKSDIEILSSEMFIDRYKFTDTFVILDYQSYKFIEESVLFDEKILNCKVAPENISGLIHNFYISNKKNINSKTYNKPTLYLN